MSEKCEVVRDGKINVGVLMTLPRLFLFRILQKSKEPYYPNFG